MASLMLAALLGAALAPAALPGAPGVVSCAQRLALQPGAAMPARAVDAQDLASLIDIGSIPEFDDPIFSISPDGDTIAVAVHRADSTTNSYCSGLVLVPIAGTPALVDSGPGLILFRFSSLNGKGDFPSGFARVMTPRWSPDGRFVAYLKPVEGAAQLWRVGKDGSSAQALTAVPGGIDDFHFSGPSISLSISAKRDAALAMDREGLSGFHYDDRFVPVATNRPFSQMPVRQDSLLLDPATRRLQRAPEPARSPVGPEPQWSAIAQPTDTDDLRVGAAQPGARPVLCRSALCLGVVGKPWMAPDDASVFYLHRQGWAGETTAIYQWPIGASAPILRYATPDLLLSCTSRGSDILCAREGSARPRYLSMIHPSTGRSETVFDPNPGFAARTIGPVRRVHWRNPLGIPCFGDLVLPPGVPVGTRLPLIVVQYSSRGFLRGGTGDEFPIQLFARAGFAVLSVQRPQSPGEALRHLSGQRQQRYDLALFRERRSIMLAIETEVHHLVAQGLVDPDRVGITGLSDGSSTVQFSLLHSHLFKAASAVGCCWEPSQAWLLGGGTMQGYRALGWPADGEDHKAFWHRLSLARNAQSIRTPLLIDAADDEYLASLESVSALQAAGAPVDLYVFPGEHHVKWQPAHRLAVYQRNLDWFEFWLMGRAPTHAPDHDAEAARWTSWKRTLRGSRMRPPAAITPSD